MKGVIFTYPHSELVALVSALADPLGKEPDEIVRWFGRHEGLDGSGDGP